MMEKYHKFKRTRTRPEFLDNLPERRKSEIDPASPAQISRRTPETKAKNPTYTRMHAT